MNMFWMTPAGSSVRGHRILRTTAVALFLSAATVSVSVATAVPAAANLLINGSAETGDIVPWVATANGVGINDADAAAGILSVSIAQDNKPLSAFDGERFFSFSESGANAEGNQFIMTQTGTLTGGTSLLTLSGVYASEFEDFGTAQLSVFDASSALLAETSITNLNNALDLNNDFTWTAFSLGLPVVPQAASWKVTLTGELVTGGSINLYWDDLSLAAQSVPEPGSLALVVSGLAGLGIFRRRRLRA